MALFQPSSPAMYPYQRLIVWQRAHALTVSFYHAAAFDESTRYRALVLQVRRCAGSVGANIAEGAASGSQASFARYLGIALASAHELESHLLLARDIGCVKAANCAQWAKDVESIKKMLTVLQRTVRSRSKREKKTDGTV
jgi:four helix bundle protein